MQYSDSTKVQCWQQPQASLLASRFLGVSCYFRIVVLAMGFPRDLINSWAVCPLFQRIDPRSKNAVSTNVSVIQVHDDHHYKTLCEDMVFIALVA